MDTKIAGFREIAHTADWELEVWAPDMVGLLEQAALGMYRLMGIRLGNSTLKNQILKFNVKDDEELLVSFLSELLYFCEMEGVAFKQFQFTTKDESLSAKLVGSPIISIDKEIKAITYHNLKIQKTSNGVTTRIVFDV